jgi:hypothetical protein
MFEMTEGWKDGTKEGALRQFLFIYNCLTKLFQTKICYSLRSNIDKAVVSKYVSSLSLLKRRGFG